MKAGILSDTHSYIDEMMVNNLSFCDEIWHAGDIGSLSIYDQLAAIKPVRAVYGNIDGHELRSFIPEFQIFDAEGMKVIMTHIGGYPGRYERKVRELLKKEKADIFISGHSHILKILPDNEHNLLHINPGAAGKYGLHKVRTMIIIEILANRISDLKVVEMGKKEG